MKYKIQTNSTTNTNTNTRETLIQLYNISENYMKAEAPICTAYRHKKYNKVSP